MKKILVFDFDGTIADTFPHFLTIGNKLAEKYSFKKITESDIARLQELDSMRVFQELNIPLWRVPFIVRDGRAELHNIIDETTPVKGIKEQLEKLHMAGCTLGILTSNSEKNVVKFLARNKIQVFDFIYSGSSLFGKEKVIRSMVRQKKVDPEDVLYVGDETRDIEASRKAGIRVAAVTWGFSSRKGLEKYKPDFLIDKPEELLKIVANSV